MGDKPQRARAREAPEDQECCDALSTQAVDASVNRLSKGGALRAGDRALASDELARSTHALHDSGLTPQMEAAVKQLGKIVAGGDIKQLEAFVKTNAADPNMAMIVRQLNNKTETHDLRIEWDPAGKQLSVYNIGMTALKRFDSPVLLVNATGEPQSSAHKFALGGKLEPIATKPADVFAKQSENVVQHILYEKKDTCSTVEALKTTAALLKAYDKKASAEIDIATEMAIDLMSDRISDVANTLRSKNYDRAKMGRIVQHMNALTQPFGVTARVDAEGLVLGYLPGLINGYAIGIPFDATQQPRGVRLNAGTGPGVTPLVWRPNPEDRVPEVAIPFEEALDKLQKRLIDGQWSQYH